MERDLIGVDPTDLEKVYWIMDRAAAHSGSAKNAIDMACYDLLGKKAGMPVYKLLEMCIRDRYKNIRSRQKILTGQNIANIIERRFLH